MSSYKKITKLSSDEHGLFGIPMLGHIHGHEVRVAPPSSPVPAWGPLSCDPLNQISCFFIPSRIPAQSIALQCCVLQNSAGSTLQQRRCEDHPTSQCCLYHKCLYWHDASIFSHVRIISSWFWFQLSEECLIMFNNDPALRVEHLWCQPIWGTY